MLIFWIIVFSASIFVMIKAADYFTEGAEKIGLAFKIPPLIVGATIISIGTSLPELATAITAAFHHQTEIVTAAVIGANITNVLLIVGLAAIVAGRLVVKKSVFNMELPIFAAAITLAAVFLWDRQVTAGEGIVAILGYLVYIAFSIKQEKEEKSRLEGIVPGEDLPVTKKHRYHLRKKYKPLDARLYLFLLLSVIFLYFGSQMAVKSLTEISLLAALPASLVAMSLMAFSTSLPELIVTVIAAKKGRFEIALGTIFGSNIFNVLIIMGVASLVNPLKVDEATMMIGLPFIIGSTMLYIFSSLAKRIYYWEGFMYLLIYLLYLAKLFKFV